jgi:hypothetical protein
MKDVCCCCGLDKKTKSSLPDDLNQKEIVLFNHLDEMIPWFDHFLKHSLSRKVTVVAQNFTSKQVDYLNRQGIQIIQVIENIYEDGLSHFYEYRKGGFIKYK